MSTTVKNMASALARTSSVRDPLLCSGSYIFFVLENIAAFDFVRDHHFTDERSRQVFDWVVQYRIMRSLFGMSPVELENTPFTAARWAELEAEAARLESPLAGDYLLDRIDTWLLESYTLPGLCEVCPGDVVLDCGAYTGNTSVYFSRKAGAGGRVFGFEPAGKSFLQLKENVSTFANITAVNSALGAECGRARFSAEDDFAAKLKASGGVEVSVTTIDAFCRAQDLQRVDFIKMDVEGAEADALWGAAGIIARNRPKMALSIYHKPEDLIELSNIVLEICPTYKFQLRHFSPNEFETVLYCYNDERSADLPVYRHGGAGRYLGQTDLLIIQKAVLPVLSKLCGDNSIRMAQLIHSHAVTLQEHAREMEALSRQNAELLVENRILKKMLAQTHAPRPSEVIQAQGM